MTSKVGLAFQREHARRGLKEDQGRGDRHIIFVNDSDEKILACAEALRGEWSAGMN